MSALLYCHGLAGSSINFCADSSAGRAPPPGAMVSARRMERDRRAEPEYGERVPYIIIESEAGKLQVDKAVTPLEFLSDS